MASDKEITDWLTDHTGTVPPPAPPVKAPSDSDLEAWLNDKGQLPASQPSMLDKLKSMAAPVRSNGMDIVGAISGDPVSTLRTLANNAQEVNNLAPAVGGIVGGITGGIPGAALGGAAGSAFKQLNNRVLGNPTPQTSIDAAKSIGLDAAKQAAYETGAQAVGATVKGAEALAKYFGIGNKVGSLARLPEGSLGAAYENPEKLLPIQSLGGAPTEQSVKEAYSAAVAPLKEGGKELTAEEALKAVTGGKVASVQQNALTVYDALKEKNPWSLSPNQVYEAERYLADAKEKAFNAAINSADNTLKTGKRVLQGQVSPKLQEMYNTVRSYLDTISPDFANASKQYSEQAIYGPLRNVLPRNAAGRPDWSGMGLRGLVLPGLGHLAQSPILQGTAAATIGAAARIAKTAPVVNSGLQAIRQYLYGQASNLGR